MKASIGPQFLGSQFLKLFMLVVLAGGVFGCSSANFPKVQTLGGLRVLGIQASQPEVSSSALPAVVNLTPILSDLGSGGRTVTISAQACLDPGVSLGATPSCAGVPGTVDLAPITVNPSPVANNSQTFGTPSLTGAVSAMAVTVPAGLLAGRNAVDQYNGVGYLVSFRVSAGADVVLAYKRIVVSNRTLPNTNPDLTGVFANGGALTALPSAAVNLTAAVTGTTTIDYLDQSGSLKSRGKNFTVSYFISDGEIRRSKIGPTEDNKWTPPVPAPSGRPTTIVALVYDGNGGMDFLITDL